MSASKRCRRMVDKFGLRTWIYDYVRSRLGFTYVVFKTTCVDRGKALREGAFSRTRTTLFPPLDKENPRAKQGASKWSHSPHLGGATRVVVSLHPDYPHDIHADQRNILQPAGRRCAHGQGLDLHPPEPMQPPLQLLRHGV